MGQKQKLTSLLLPDASHWLNPDQRPEAWSRAGEGRGETENQQHRTEVTALAVTATAFEAWPSGEGPGRGLSLEKQDAATPSRCSGTRVCSPQTTLSGFGAKKLPGEFQRQRVSWLFKALSATKDRRGGGKTKALASRRPAEQPPGHPPER